MSFLVDTDTCSAQLRNAPGVTARFLQYGGRLHVSVVSLAELFSWALRASAPPTRLDGLLALMDDMAVLDVNSQIARKFGEIQAGLLDIGQPAPAADLLIASTALVHGLAVVTHNVQDFARVPGLTVVDWLTQ